jgi:23S rRNA pseudouridine1911/1915/1917 synthase
MAERTTEKEYLAVVFGHVPIKARGTIAAALARDPYDRRRVIVTSAGGRPSLTRYERIAGMPVPAAGVSLVRCQLVTGRMHQIRVHLKWCGWPIVGDAIYGEPRWRAVIDGQLAHALQSFPRQALHAARLALVHPMTRERLIVESPMPCDLHMLLQTCGF